MVPMYQEMEMALVWLEKASPIALQSGSLLYILLETLIHLIKVNF